MVARARSNGSAAGRKKRAGREYGGLIMKSCSRPLAGVLAVATVVAAAMAAQPAAAREIVNFKEGSAGSIVIKTNERHLYYVLGNGKAVRYLVGVGKAGKRWSGTTSITGKYRRPDWAPPKEVKRDKPKIPDLIKGGSPRNPMGEAAQRRAEIDRKQRDRPEELHGRKGPDPVRYGDWEVKGIASDF